MSHQFKHFSRSAGLEWFKLHSLRHTFSVRLIESGADILVLSKLLEDSGIKTSFATLRIS
ncbi:MAG: tyrosine-type recombinase/integrase [Bacteroidota bacterium]